MQTQETALRQCHHDIIRLTLLTRNTALRKFARFGASKLLDGDFPSRHNFAMQKNCAKCQAPMDCQPEGGCWCAELPHLPMPADAAATGCLCRECLIEKIKSASVSSTASSVNSGSTDSISTLPRS
jgi:hypothetical protein